MGNELKIILGSGIVLILTDYFKMFGEETRKNRSLISNIIKYSLISAGIILFLGIFDIYGFNPHLYREFSENDVDIYSTLFFSNIGFLLAFNSLFNWIDRFLVKYVYYKISSKFGLKMIYYLTCSLMCLLLSLYFSPLTPFHRYRVLKQDVVVTDNLGKQYIVKENSTFDFEYEDIESKSEQDKKSIYETDDSLYILKKGSKIKLLSGNKIYSMDENSLEYITNKNKRSKEVIYTISGESIILLNEDDIFTLQKDVKISLAQRNKYKSLFESQFYIFCFYLFFYNLILFAFWVFMPLVKGSSKSIDDVWKLSEHVAFHTSKDMLENISQNNSYDLNSFFEDKQTFYNLKYQVQEIKCKIGDIIVDCKNHEATIVSQKNEGKTDLSEEFLLLRINDKSIRSDYLLFIIQNYLKNTTVGKLDQKELITELKRINLKLPWKVYQKLVVKEYKVYLQKELLLDEYFKNIFEESKQENVF